MLFNEFCECTGDLSTSTETEVKKYTKRNILEQRKTERQRQSHRRSIAAHQPIDRPKFRRIREKPESLPIDRAKLADRLAELRNPHRRNADRSWHSSRSIGNQRFLIPHERRSIMAYQPIDRPELFKQNDVVFQA